MSEAIELHVPCPVCPSSDAFVVYDTGWGHCFSCGANVKLDGDQVTATRVSKEKRGLVPFGEYGALRKRGINEETARKYGYFLGEFKGKRVQVAPYHDANGKLIAQKVRFPGKSFLTTGDFKNVTLFGQHLWKRGGKRIVITEGEIDTLTVAQVLGLTWPVVGLPNGAQSARKALQKSLEYLNSFENVVLMFDEDEAGRKAVEECVDLFPPGKVSVARLPRKDPNEMLQAGEAKEIIQAVWNAQTYRPDGVVEGKELWDRVRTPIKPGTMFPWRGLNNLTYGIRESELWVLGAGSGVGKSTAVAEIGYDMVMRQGETLGAIFLEESVERAARRILGIHLGQPLHLPTHTASEADLRRAFDETLGSGRFHFLDHFGSLDEEVLLNRMRYMVKGLGCTVIILDHVSLVASGADLETDERRFLDHLMTSLRSFVQETGVKLLCVSHLSRPSNDRGHEGGAETSLKQFRGSHAIVQLADGVLGLERDLQAETEEERNAMHVRVLKARATGMTGPATTLHYERKTGRLMEEAVAALDREDRESDDADDELPF